MAHREHFWRLDELSDRQLLERLQGVLHSQRCALAELVAHLGEVEERRLHLAAAYSSLFSYCVQHLGMSEDEACRRIELAQLARRFPLLFVELASGRISLSVALLLKPVLTADNHAQLFAAARGASLRTARELLAARFPSPDVPSLIRKLPERSSPPALPVTVAGSALAKPAAIDVADAIPEAGAADTHVAHSLTSSPQPAGPAASGPGVRVAGSLHEPAALAEPSHAVTRIQMRHADRPRVDPLSAGRYRVQFTADAGLKQKLELARDLLRHSHPSGDLAPILSRALDLLLQELMQRRFGARKGKPRRSASTASPAAPTAQAAATASAMVTQPASAQPSSRQPSSSSPVTVCAPAPLAASSVTPPLAAAACAATACTRMSAAADAPAALPAAVSAPERPVTASSATPPLAASSSATPPSAAVPSRPPRRAPSPSSRIARAARRDVVGRDGLGCCWVDATGRRCGSTAWLELDHRHPSGKGGTSEPGNLRLLCRAHNRFAAERAYGREHIEQAIRSRQEDATRRRKNLLLPHSPTPA